MVATQIEDFVDPASISDDLLCSICTGVFLDPQAGPCGHHFCGPCIEQWLEASSRRTSSRPSSRFSRRSSPPPKASTSCPMCRAEVNEKDLTVCASLAKECDELQVRCPWRCGWSGRRDEQAEHTTVCPVGYFVDVTVPIDGPLGVILEVLGDLMLVGTVHANGPVDRYNKAHKNDETRLIRPNDQVVQVDGVSGDANFLTYLIKRPGRKSVTFRHPQEFAISVTKKKGSELGLDLSWSEPSGILTVLGVDADRARQDEAGGEARSASKRLERNDRIIEVNGVACVGNANTVVPLLRDSQDFTIKFHRPRSNSVCSL